MSNKIVFTMNSRVLHSKNFFLSHEHTKEVVSISSFPKKEEKRELKIYFNDRKGLKWVHFDVPFFECEESY